MDGILQYRRSTFSVANSKDSGPEMAGPAAASGPSAPAAFFPPRRSSFSTSGAAAAKDARQLPYSLSSSSQQAQKVASLKRGGISIPKRVASQRGTAKSAAYNVGSKSKIYETPYFGASLAMSGPTIGLSVQASQGMHENKGTLPRSSIHMEPKTFAESTSQEFRLGVAAVTPPGSGTVTPSSSASGPSADDLLDVRAMQLFEHTPEGDESLPDDKWLAMNEERGFVRVHTSDGSYSGAERCMLGTTAGELADRIGSKWLFLCDSSGSVRRMAGSECPLAVQVEKLKEMGYEGSRLQQYGQTVEAGHCIRFYDGELNITTIIFYLCDSTYRAALV